MKKHKWITDDTDEFMLALLELKNLAEARAFLGDVFTTKELTDMANRWKIAKMLHFGVGYRKIERLTGVSSATIAKIQRVMHQEMGGYRLLIGKLSEKQKRSSTEK